MKVEGKSNSSPFFSSSSSLHLNYTRWDILNPPVSPRARKAIKARWFNQDTQPGAISSFFFFSNNKNIIWFFFFFNCSQGDFLGIQARFLVQNFQHRCGPKGITEVSLLQANFYNHDSGICLTAALLIKGGIISFICVSGAVHPGEHLGSRGSLAVK